MQKQAVCVYGFIRTAQSLFALKYMKEPNELTSLCEESLSSIIGLALHLLKILEFNREDSQQLFSVCVYARLVELACACNALLEKNSLIGIPVLLRSMFEASVDLSNLIKHPEYTKTMLASFLKEKFRITKEVIKDDSNPFFESIKTNQNLNEVLQDTQQMLKQLTSEGHSPKSFRDRAEQAGKINEYLSVYNTLCLDTHNNIRSLEDWHIDISSLGEYHTVIFKKEKSDLMNMLCAIPSMLLHQTKAIADFLNVKEIEFKKYFEELYALQQSVKEFFTAEQANERIKADGTEPRR
ncbi:DUF5677 domain-containing protein [Thermodesulfobacteriota bacterium]